MTELSQSQIDFIQCLRFLELEEQAIVAIALMIKTDEQIAEMAEFLLSHPEATQSDLLRVAVEISDSTENQATTEKSTRSQKRTEQTSCKLHATKSVLKERNGANH